MRAYTKTLACGIICAVLLGLVILVVALEVDAPHIPPDKSTITSCGKTGGVWNEFGKICERLGM